MGWGLTLRWQKFVLSNSFYSDALTSWGLVTLGETAPPRASSFLDRDNNFDKEHTFHMQANLKPISQSSLVGLSQASSIQTTIPLPNHPSTSYQTTRDSPYTPKPTEIIQTSQSYPCVPCLALSCSQKPQKGSCLHFLLIPSAS